MSTARISEIFQSIQGEGQYVGVKQVFVRFFGCNIHCTWCDTPSSIGDASRHYKELTLDAVAGQVRALWQNCHSVSLTGGEPLLQKDFLRKFLPVLHKNKMPAYLETSGILAKEFSAVVDLVDIVSMDIKLPSSAKQGEFWKEHEQFLKIAKRAKKKDIFIKVVITSDTCKEDIERAVALAVKLCPKILFILQPNTYELQDGALAKSVEFHNYCLQYLPNSRIMPQMHKFMKIP